MSTEASPVGVLLVGGFLGAGKTTLVTRLMRDPEIGGRLAVLVNELGPGGIDGEIIGAARANEWETAALRTVQLDSGCLCCTLKGELGQALMELARPASGPPPAQIIVELSGGALSSEVHFQIATQALDAPYYPDGLVCVIDAHQAPRWAHEVEPLFLDQLQRADLVLLSKLDLATPAERAATEALIAEHAPGARVIASVFGDVSPSLLLGCIEPAPPRKGSGAAHALDAHTIAIPSSISAARLEALLESLTPHYFRIKGIVDVDGAPTLVQCVGDQIALAAAPTSTGSRRLTFIGPPGHSIDLEAAVRRALVAGPGLGLP